jgi:inorganic pyrophosphatase
MSGYGDAIVYMDEALVPGSFIKCRIIGCLETVDEKREDAKLILVPAKKVCPMTSDIESVHDLPKRFIEKITYFYQHYKDLEKNR